MGEGGGGDGNISIYGKGGCVVAIVYCINGNMYSL